MRTTRYFWLPQLFVPLETENFGNRKTIRHRTFCDISPSDLTRLQLGPRSACLATSRSQSLHWEVPMARKPLASRKPKPSKPHSAPPPELIPPTVEFGTGFLVGWWALHITGLNPVAPRPPWPLPPDPKTGRLPRPAETRLLSIVGLLSLDPFGTNNDGQITVWSFTASHGGVIIKLPVPPGGGWPPPVLGTYNLPMPFGGYMRLPPLPNSPAGLTYSQWDFVVSDAGRQLFLILTEPALPDRYPAPSPDGSIAYPPLGGVLSGVAKKF